MGDKAVSNKLKRLTLIFYYEIKEVISTIKMYLHESIQSETRVNLNRLYAEKYYGKIGCVHKYYDNKMELLDRKKVIEFIINKYVNEGTRILDVGCGTGLFEKYLSFKNKNGTRIDAIDISQDMLDIAKRKNITTNNISWLKGDMHDLPNLTKKKYDLIICLGIERFIFCPKLFFKNIPQVLARNGIVLFRTYKKNTFLFVAEKVLAALTKRKQNLSLCYSHVIASYLDANNLKHKSYKLKINELNCHEMIEAVKVRED